MEIERLRRCRPQDPGRRRSEAFAYGHIPAKLLRYAPEVRDDEIEGYGSSAHWR